MCISHDARIRMNLSLNERQIYLVLITIFCRQQQKNDCNVVMGKEMSYTKQKKVIP